MEQWDERRYILSCGMDEHDANPRIRSMRGPAMIIALWGPSCSGKSILVSALEAHWGSDRVSMLPIGTYYRDHSHLPMEERVKCNFDAPDAIDWSLLAAHLARIVAGTAIKRPSYYFATHARTREVVSLESRPILIVEGIFALWFEGIRSLATVGVYVDLSSEDCLRRRIVRDRVERGRSEPQIREQFERFVQPMAERYVFPTKAFADLVVQGDDPVQQSVRRVVAFLGKRRTSG